MKPIITIIITFFLFLNSSFAQEYCGTPDDSPNQNEYSAYYLIESDVNTSVTEKTKEKVKDKDIQEEALFDIYGVKVKSYNKNLFETNHL